MNGRLVSVRPTKYEFNEKICPVCAALPGTACIRQQWEGGRGNRPETHRSMAERLGVEFPFTDEFIAKHKRRRPRRR